MIAAYRCFSSSSGIPVECALGNNGRRSMLGESKLSRRTITSRLVFVATFDTYRVVFAGYYLNESDGRKSKDGNGLAPIASKPEAGGAAVKG